MPRRSAARDGMRSAVRVGAIMMGTSIAAVWVLVGVAASQPPAPTAAGADVSTTSVAHPSEPDPAPAPYGLYPIWEETGAVESSLSARVGFGHAQVALGPVTIGTQPFLDLY